MKLFDVYANWCGQCKSIDPIIEEIKKEHNIEVIKVDVEKDLTFCDKFNIISLPTLLFINDEGNEVDRICGLVSKKIIVDKLKKMML